MSFQLHFLHPLLTVYSSASSRLPKPLASVPHSCLVSFLPVMSVPKLGTWNTCTENLSAGCQREDHLINSIHVHIQIAHRFFTLKTSTLSLSHSLVILPPVRFKIVNWEESESLECFQRRECVLETPASYSHYVKKVSFIHEEHAVFILLLSVPIFSFPLYAATGIELTKEINVSVMIYISLQD